jgi:phosphoribosyl-AMP cyclohydrolase / phosphoribosyl-ATP pyrophosphohydrolase
MPEPHAMPALDLDADALDWNKQGGLLPAIVQHADGLQVLMLGWMDRDALAATLATGRVTFYSRSRQRLWTKGETSGHVLDLVAVEADCDRDTLLVQARPRGPTCHLGRPSCFPQAPESFLPRLDAVLADRAARRPAGSYTTGLLDAGVRAVAQKVGEEGVALAGEAADLLFHLLVLLRARGLSLADAERELRRRHAGAAGVDVAGTELR